MWVCYINRKKEDWDLLVENDIKVGQKDVVEWKYEKLWFFTYFIIVIILVCLYVFWSFSVKVEKEILTLLIFESNYISLKYKIQTP